MWPIAQQAPWPKKSPFPSTVRSFEFLIPVCLQDLHFTLFDDAENARELPLPVDCTAGAMRWRVMRSERSVLRKLRRRGKMTSHDQDECMTLIL